MPFATFNPRDLIRPPYWDCPFCRAAGTFGVLMVGGHCYTRRCKACWKTENFELPQLDLKFLYLDQFFLSNVVRMLDPQTDPERLRRLEPHGPFYRQAFEKIHRLCKLHLLVCPDSPVHYDESVVSSEFRKLKRLWELLSHGAKLHRPGYIRNAQVLRFARKWSGVSHDAEPVGRGNVMLGRFNEWKDWYQITLNVGVIPGLTGDLREARDKKYEGFLGVFALWAKEKHRGFPYWLTKERTALSQVLKERLTRELQIRSSRAERSFDDVLASMDENFRLLVELAAVFREAGIGADEILVKTWECLECEAFGEVPFVKISSHIFAALARRAAQNQKPPGKHPFNDVDAIAAYLPFCDALFIDKEMDALLKEQPLRKELDYGGKVFSLRTKNEFLEYLDEIERSASLQHLEKIREVYGDEWAKPYVEVFRDFGSEHA